MRYFITYFFLSFLLTGLVVAQDYEILGRVSDADSGEPIPYASIVLPDQFKGTSTNIEGNFLFKIDSLPVRLRFSHISYITQELLIEEEKEIQITLKPAEILMDELVVEEKEQNEYVYQLVENAFERIKSYAGRSKYGKAFYRQISKNDEEYNELFEIFYDARFTRIGIADWAIQEGRYALKSNSAISRYLYNKNFTLLYRLFSMIQPETDDLIQPVNEAVQVYYNLKIRALISVDGKKVAVVQFIPKPDIVSPIMEGVLYIDIDNYDLIKLKGRIVHDDLNFITLSEKDSHWKNYILHFDAAYKAEPDGDVYLDYLTMEQEMDYYVGEELAHHVNTRGFLTFYEYYTPEKQKRLGGRLIKYRQRDREVLDRLGYNSKFWKENPIVKRTPIEEEVIEAFEKDEAFGSIYLNNRDQLILEGNELKNNSFIQGLSKSLRETRLAGTGEKVYLHIDKPFYTLGETLWFKAYLVNAATHELAETSGLLNLELISPKGEIVKGLRIRLNGGKGNGQMEIPMIQSTGSYKIRAYTNWMRNFGQEFFYSHRLMIYNPEVATTLPEVNPDFKGIDLQFFPEGGNLIANIPGVLAFKALAENGKSMELTGALYDQDGNKAGNFSTSHKGMGSMILSTRSNNSYYAVIDGDPQGTKYNLPKIQEDGFSVMVNNLKPNSIDVLLKASVSKANEEFYIVCQSRGLIYHAYKGACRNRVARAEIPKSKLPDGIIQITIFDMMQRPVVERLVFNNGFQQPVISISSSGNKNGSRDQLILDLQISDVDGKPVKNSSLSISVLDADQIRQPFHSENIQTYLLLNSDLRGAIEDPAEYFLDETKQTLKNLDLVMLTHGWRRFKWEDLLNDEKRKKEFAWRMEQGINISGKAYQGESNKNVTNDYLDFVPINTYGKGLWRTNTDPQGNWSLKDVLLEDTTRVLVRRIDKNGQQQDVRVVLDPVSLPEASPFIDYPLAVDEKLLNTYLKNDKKRKNFDGSYNSDDREILLDEVTVATSKPFNSIYGKPDNVIVLDDRDRGYSDLLQLLQGRVAGLSITGGGDNTQIQIRGNSSLSGNGMPLIILDGMIISDASSQQSDPVSAEVPPIPTGPPGNEPQSTDIVVSVSPTSSNVIPMLQSISPMNVERIEVLKNASSAGAFGMRGANGVIAIYTRRGDDLRQEVPVANMSTTVLPGFQAPREFYMPNYEIKVEGQSKPDLRPTLYWNPEIVTNRRGRARISFYNNDEAKTFQILIQGITEDGRTAVLNEVLGEKLIK